jgi:hypothetical protein
MDGLLIVWRYGAEIYVSFAAPATIAGVDSVKTGVVPKA